MSCDLLDNKYKAGKCRGAIACLRASGGGKEHPRTSAHALLRDHLSLLLMLATHAKLVLTSSGIIGAVCSLPDARCFSSRQPGACGCDVARAIRGRAIKELRLHSRGAALQYSQDVTTAGGSVLMLMFDAKCWARQGRTPSCSAQRGCASNACRRQTLGAWQPMSAFLPLTSMPA